MISITSMLLALAPLSIAMPTVSPRAGGPAIVPIPANCTQTSIVLADCAANFTITPSFIDTYGVYSINLEADYYDEAGLWQQCKEQCYGYGTDGTCISVFLSENAKGMSYGYNTTGLQCLFFSANITQADLVETTDGFFANSQALNRWCPSPRA